MSYESEEMTVDKSNWNSYSTDLINWQRLSKDPILSNYVYCSAFLKVVNMFII